MDDHVARVPKQIIICNYLAAGCPRHAMIEHPQSRTEKISVSARSVLALVLGLGGPR